MKSNNKKSVKRKHAQAKKKRLALSKEYKKHLEEERKYAKMYKKLMAADKKFPKHKGMLGEPEAYKKKAAPKKKAAEKKISKVMREFKEKKLHSGSKKGPLVKNPKQAIAIALSEARKKVKRKKK